MPKIPGRSLPRATHKAMVRIQTVPLAKKKPRALSDREQKFVEIWLTGAGEITMRDAAIEAGYPPKSAQIKASQLTDPRQYPHVVEYIKRRQVELAERYGTTFERHMKDLKMIRDKALESGAYSAAVMAEYRRGQALGNIYIDRKEIRTGTIDSMSKEEVEQKLKELKKSFLDISDAQVVESIEKEKLVDKELKDEDLNGKGKKSIQKTKKSNEAVEDSEGGDLGK